MTEPQNTEPAGDRTSGPAPDPQSDADTPEAAAAVDDTEAIFADAFAPPWQADDGGGKPSAADYATWVAEYEAEQDDSTDADTDDEEKEAEPASRREARYRIRAREAEAQLADAAAENSRLHDELDAMRRSQALTLAAGRLADPAGDLFREHQLDAVLADDGTVDPLRVNVLADEIIAARPHLAAPRPAADINRLQSGAHQPSQPAVPSWERAFVPRAK